ncbi:RNA polymerase sigma factor [Streptomyces sp. OR43]|uniref:RNA polymerase sigma factor n=1 Tax=Streptomyces sp. or43 TaxID=2478957 RepID=UPI0011CDB48D|nr:sigma-70 family RNA polymerase sigma factor [Streptomyces sp. or43]TXS36607.1 sigma-70 family RNA polymerase sigma factor [Streptomyces sp. or43]
MESNQTVSEPGRSTRFTALYTREYPRVHAFAHRRTGNGGEAEEIAAEVFRIAWEHELGGGETTPGWLFVTARNVLGNHYRSTTRLSELHRRIGEEVGRAATSPEDSTVLDTLDRLPGPHREVLLLSYWDGLTAAEAAAVLGCGTSAVWVRLHRARKAFREHYTSSGESA